MGFFLGTRYRKQGVSQFKPLAFKVHLEPSSVFVANAL